MNAAGDFRYVTRGGFADFEDAPGLDEDRPDVARLPAAARARAAALFPGGPYARRLAGHNVVETIGDTVFVHGGLTPAWTGRIDETNRSARCWLDHQGPPPAVLDADDGPVWSRRYGGDHVDCDEVRQVLAAVGAARMVVAHTTQAAGITSACGGRVWRIDAGLSSFYGGPIEVLEIEQRDGGDRVRVLRGKRP